MFPCRIVYSGGKIFFQENVDCVVFPSLKGPYALFQNHAPMVFSLKPGVVVFKRFEERHLFLISKGAFLYENKNLSVLITDDVVRLENDSPEEREKGYQKLFGGALKHS